MRPRRVGEKEKVVKIPRIPVGFGCAFILAFSIFQINVAHAKKTLYLYNWSQYMDPAILKAFEKKYDVDISRNFFASNPEMFAKLQAGGDSQYDVIFPSSYFITRLTDAGLIQPLDKSLIPNLDNLYSRFKNPKYDPHSKYSVAYLWGDTGIIYNTKKLPDAPKSWSLIYDPKVNPDYPFAMLDAVQTEFGTACAYLGLGYACASRKDWKKAAKLILKTKKRPNFSGFIEGTPTNQRVARGAIAVGVTFNGDYVFDVKHDPNAYADTKFIVPKEGSELWVDTMAIPKHAPHPKLAHKFINFILKAKIGAKLANWNFYTSPNKAAKPYLNEALTKPPIMPTQDEMKKLHFTPAPEGEDLQFQQQLWTQIVSQ
jgi:spermidine/putrescine transport system substrate-binding protein